MKNELRQRQLFSEELPTWEALPDELQQTMRELLSLLLEQELASSIKQQNQKKEPNHV